MTRRRSVGWLVAASAASLAVLAVFAYAISANQSSAHRRLQTVAHQRAVLVSGLIDTVFALQAHVSHDALVMLSAARVPRHYLDNFANNTRYTALLDAHGRIIAHSDGFTATDRANLNTADPVSLISGGRAWGVSDVLGNQVVDLVSRVDTPTGERALVSGVALSSLSSFVDADLHKVPGVVAQHQLLLDGRGVVVGSTNPQRPTGYRFHTRAQLAALDHRSGVVSTPLGSRYFDQVALAGTGWKLIVSVPSTEFFASVSGIRHWLPWILFIAFGLAMLGTLLLAARAIKSRRQIRDANLALARSNAILELQAQELVRSNSELDQFASIASHDLQEPLRKVRTFTERVADIEADNLSERGVDYLRRANASAERMQVLIEDLLRYSRVTTHARPFAAVDLAAVVAEVLDDLSEQVIGAGAEVRVGGLPTISADAPQMRQLLQNLISNALKFRRDGVALVVSVDGEMEGDWLTLTIADNGIGFEPQYAQRIFRVFERLHGRGTYPGTGIGLALCRKIAERHGGSVVATGVPDVGATFTVTLQTRRSQAVDGASPPVAPPVPPVPSAPSRSPGSAGPAASPRSPDPAATREEEPYVPA